MPCQQSLATAQQVLADGLRDVSDALLMMISRRSSSGWSSLRSRDRSAVDTGPGERGAAAMRGPHCDIKPENILVGDSSLASRLLLPVWFFIVWKEKLRVNRWMETQR